jgi:hypothetical protein
MRLIPLQSDYNVCNVCGSLAECSHDSGQFDGPDTMMVPCASDADAMYEMITNAAIPPHAEIFNTYGSTLTNAQLLARYGFILEDGNANDGVGWLEGDLRAFAVRELSDGSELDRVRCHESGPAATSGSGPERVDGIMDLWRALLHLEQGDKERFWENSDLVYDPAQNDMEAGSIGKHSHMITDVDKDARAHIVLRVNGDAQMTYQLWLFCAVLHLDVDSIREEQVDGDTTESPSLTLEDVGPEARNRDVCLKLVTRCLRNVADWQAKFEREAWGDDQERGA